MKRGGQPGHIVSKETRRKISLSRKGKFYPNAGTFQKGHIVTKEMKRKIRLGNIGKQLGKKLSAEQLIILDIKERVNIKMANEPTTNEPSIKRIEWKIPTCCLESWEDCRHVSKPEPKKEYNPI